MKLAPSAIGCVESLCASLRGRHGVAAFGMDCPIGGFRLALLRVETADLVIDETFAGRSSELRSARMAVVDQGYWGKCKVVFRVSETWDKESLINTSGRA